MIRRLRFLFRNLFRRRQADRDLVAELGAYADEMNSRAHPRVSPRIMTEPLREEVRAARLGAGLEAWARDLRYAARMLHKAPGLTLACVLTFAVGIGANTMVFSMANALVFRQLPVPHPAQIEYLQMLQQSGTAHAPSRADLDAIAAQSGAVFSGVATASMESVGLKAGGVAHPVWASRVSGNFFSLMGVHPALGTFFSDDRVPTLVLSYDYWQSRFFGDRGIIGQSATVDGVPVTIIGVTPRGFHGFTTVLDLEAYFPRDLGVAQTGFMTGLPLARLRDGVSPATVRTELAVIAQRLAAAHSAEDKGLVINTVPIGSGTAISSSGHGANPLAIVSELFLALSGLVLLLAAANVMGLLLARASARQREMGVRAALGGSRLRLARQVFLETLLLTTVGAAAGMAAGALGSRALSGAPATGGFPLVLDFSFDWRVFCYGLGLALLVALAAGMVPAWRAAGADPNQALRRDRWLGNPRQRLRSLLVVAQVAGSLALLIVGGLFVRSLRQAQKADLGFRPDQVVNFPLDPSGAGYDAARGQQFFDQVLARAQALPGVAAASLTQLVPFGLEYDDGGIELDGHHLPPSRQSPPVGYNSISPGYFQTMRVPILQGRGFAPGDNLGAPVVCVVNQALAQRYWPGQSPLGHRLALASDVAHPMQVVGVVADMREQVTGPHDPFLFMPLAQHYLPAQILQVRASSGGAGASTLEVEGMLQRFDPNVPLGAVQTMNQVVDGLAGLFLFRLGAGLALGLGLLGLFLAVIGVYGVVAYAAARRTHEIGLRMALGARPAQITGAIVKSALMMIASGAGLGLLLALAFAKVAASMLAGVSALDPLTYILAVSALAIAALAAALLPAWRAMRGDPLAALHCE